MRVFALLCLIPSLAMGGTISQERREAKAREVAARFERHMRDGDMPAKTDVAISTLVRLAAKHLRKKGYKAEAAAIQDEYDTQFDGYVVRETSQRNIGDHKPLSAWLAKTYIKLENFLGIALCQALHLSDLQVINYGLPVVFHPCNPEWDEADYLAHFAHDPKYGPALVPVISYWFAFAGCEVGTWGIGWSLICGPVGMITELLVDKFVALPLGTKIYARACK